MKRCTRAQSATEFVILISFMIVIFFVFFFIIQQRIVDLSTYKDIQYLKEANNMLYSEIEIAQTVLPDYTRTFKLKQAGGDSYTIKLLDKQEIVVSYNDLEYVTFLPVEVYGNLTSSSEQTLYKKDGVVTLSNGSVVSIPQAAVISVNLDPEKCFFANASNQCCNTSIISPTLKTDCEEFFNVCASPCP